MADRFDLDAIDADDALLDLLATGGEPARAVGEHDPVLKLLADLRFAVEVEDELPVETIDDPASFLARCAALNPVTDPFARKVAARGLALGVAAVAALSVSGVAAAVNGDPLSPYEKVIEKMVDAVRPQTSFPKEQLDGMAVVDKTKIVKVAKDYQEKQTEAKAAEKKASSDDTSVQGEDTALMPPLARALPDRPALIETPVPDTTQPYTPPADLVEQPTTDPTTDPTTAPTETTTTPSPTDTTTDPAPTESTTDPTTDPTTAPTTDTPDSGTDDGGKPGKGSGPSSAPSSDPTSVPSSDSGSTDTSTGDKTQTGTDQTSAGDTTDSSSGDTSPAAADQASSDQDSVQAEAQAAEVPVLPTPTAAKHSNGRVSTGSVKAKYAKGKHSNGRYAEGKHAAVERAHGSTTSVTVLQILGVVNLPMQ